MKIKKIDIKNYRQYRDVVLTFPNTPTYDLNYVLAELVDGKIVKLIVDKKEIELDRKDIALIRLAVKF